MVSFPLLLIPLAIYNIIVFLMPGVALSAALVALPMPSGAVWSLSFADVLIALALLLLIAELAKAVRPGSRLAVEHSLAVLVFAAALAEFLLLPAFATSTFFLLIAIAFVDLVGSPLLQMRRAAAVRAVAPAAAPVPSNIAELMSEATPPRAPHSGAADPAAPLPAVEDEPGRRDELAWSDGAPGEAPREPQR